MMIEILRMSLGLLPASRLKNRLLRMLGWRIATTARVGPSLFIRVRMVSADRDARIGPLNVFRDLQDLDLGANSVIGQWNWCSASPALVAAGGKGSIELGRESAITSRHYIDASGGVVIGSFTTVAGVRSTFITHGIDWRANVQRCQSISVGDYCIVGSNNCLVPGAMVERGSVTGMGTTVGGPQAGGSLIISERGRPVKANLSGRFFERPVGFTSPEQSTK
ncbi:MAG: hypothetical protein LC775_08260 [Acidobacteria bacterium]|nr:hypothetical protein [Acidobacteriota bacterium]